SAADCADSVNNPSRGLLCDAIVALFTEKSLIHVLGSMRHGVERRHQQNDVQQEIPVPFKYHHKIVPEMSRLALPLQPDRRFGHLGTDVQHKKCGQRSRDEEAAPSEKWKYDPIRNGRQQITKRITLL